MNESGIVRHTHAASLHRGLGGPIDQRDEHVRFALELRTIADAMKRWGGASVPRVPRQSRGAHFDDPPDVHQLVHQRLRTTVHILGPNPKKGTTTN
jgi:hypothetical protein